jgi:hypothetical protein
MSGLTYLIFAFFRDEQRIEGSYRQILLTAIKIRRRLSLSLRSASIDSYRDMGREMSLKELVTLQARLAKAIAETRRRERGEIKE